MGAKDDQTTRGIKSGKGKHYQIEWGVRDRRKKGTKKQYKTKGRSPVWGGGPVVNT